jgi:hypothetical protein
VKTTRRGSIKSKLDGRTKQGKRRWERRREKANRQVLTEPGGWGTGWASEAAGQAARKQLATPSGSGQIERDHIGPRVPERRPS